MKQRPVEVQSRTCRTARDTNRSSSEHPLNEPATEVDGGALQGGGRRGKEVTTADSPQLAPLERGRAYRSPTPFTSLGPAGPAKQSNSSDAASIPTIQIL
ncbi:hypothetical protein ACTXT7_014540, partial [Hymenolepis weldensis]